MLIPWTIHGIGQGGYVGDYTETTGTVAWIAAISVAITSIFVFRRYVFEFFYVAHFAFIVVIVASVMHTYVKFLLL